MIHITDLSAQIPPKILHGRVVMIPVEQDRFYLDQTMRESMLSEEAFENFIRKV